MIGYVSLEEARSFLQNRYEDIPVDEELKRNLYKAFDKIEALGIRDSGRSEEQENHFPRVSELKIPNDIKKAQILEAYSISYSDDDSESIETGISSRSIGDMSVSYDVANKRPLLQFINLESARILSLYVRKTYGYTS